MELATGNRVGEKLQVLHDMKLPLEEPFVPNQAQFLLKYEARDPKKGLSQGAILGIFAAAAFTFSIVAIYAL